MINQNLSHTTCMKENIEINKYIPQCKMPIFFFTYLMK